MHYVLCQASMHLVVGTIMVNAENIYIKKTLWLSPRNNTYSALKWFMHCDLAMENNFIA